MQSTTGTVNAAPLNQEAAGTIAALFLGDEAEGPIVSESVSMDDENGQPDDLWLSVSPGSGDRI